MIEVQVLIPVSSNAGESFSPEHDSVFEAFLLDLFHGGSRLPGVVAGFWQDESGKYIEPTRLYVVALPSIIDAGKLAEVVTFAKAHYEQRAIYIRYLGLSEIL